MDAALDSLSSPTSNKSNYADGISFDFGSVFCSPPSPSAIDDELICTSSETNFSWISDTQQQQMS
jgi:hypothetical protein